MRGGLEQGAIRRDMRLSGGSLALGSHLSGQRCGDMWAMCVVCSPEVKRRGWLAPVVCSWRAARPSSLVSCCDPFHSIPIPQVFGSWLGAYLVAYGVALPVLCSGAET